MDLKEPLRKVEGGGGVAWCTGWREWNMFENAGGCFPKGRGEVDRGPPILTFQAHSMTHIDIVHPNSPFQYLSSTRGACSLFPVHHHLLTLILSLSYKDSHRFRFLSLFVLQEWPSLPLLPWLTQNSKPLWALSYQRSQEYPWHVGINAHPQPSSS